MTPGPTTYVTKVFHPSSPNSHQYIHIKTDTCMQQCFTQPSPHTLHQIKSLLFSSEKFDSILLLVAFFAVTPTSSSNLDSKQFMWFAIMSTFWMKRAFKVFRGILGMNSFLFFLTREQLFLNLHWNEGWFIQLVLCKTLVHPRQDCGEKGVKSRY